MKWLKKIFDFLFSPFMTGLLITLLITYIALRYYLEKSEVHSTYTSGFSQLLTWADQKSTDFRLIDRGFRPGSERVAVLAIDDRAVEEVGRWPWSRDKISHIIEQMRKHGAKVLGFDVIFSEPEKSKTLSTLEKIKRAQPTRPNVIDLINKEMLSAETDRTLAKSIATHNQNIVMGAYFDPVSLYFEPYQERCAYIAYEKTRAFEDWDKEAALIVTDSTDPDVPEALTDLLGQIFDSVIADRRQRKLEELNLSSPNEMTFSQKQILETETYEENSKYCQKWLIPDEDHYFDTFKSAWGAVQEEDEELAQLGFEDGIEVFKNRFKANPIPAVGRWWMSIPKLAEPTEHTGYFLADLDSDGTIRRSPLVVRSGEQYVPSLSLRMFLVDKGYQAQLFLKENPYNLSEKIVTDLIIADDEGEPVFTVPTDETGRLRINYAGPRQMFSYLSVADLFHDKPTATIGQQVFDEESQSYHIKEIEVNKADYIKDKLFILGATATGIYDLRVSPFEENFPGVETHTNVLDNLIRQDFLTTHPDEELYMIAVLLTFGLILSFTLAKLGAIFSLFMTVFLLFSVYYIDKFYIFKSGIAISIIFPIALICTLYIFLTFYKYFTEERKKKELKGTFAKYVSPSIVDEILSDPENVELGGRKERMTVLFSDIRGFTTISEKLDPSALSDLLNSYLTPMTQLVFDNKGTLDKYMGDAVMAFFGAPISFSDHAKYGCRCALQMLETLKDLQAEYKGKGLPNIDIGIGLNTGEMSVGNMGSEIVRSYTVMGDAVNLGSRLEGINKQYGTRIIISEFTNEDVKDSFVTREIDWVRVKGKLEPVKIFELVSENKASEKMTETIKWFDEGFLEYHKKNWEKAIDHFTHALNVNPEDETSKLYVERCQNYLQSPPPDDWDGVFIMTSK